MEELLPDGQSDNSQPQQDGALKSLVEAIIYKARRLGYGELWLRTLPTMNDARALFRTKGFTPMPSNPESALCMRLPLIQRTRSDELSR